MNEYRFHDLVVGLSEAFEYKVVPDALLTFRTLTGDINPLHNDETFAMNHGYPGRVVYGMLSASLISTLGGVYLPGKYCLIQQVESKFLSPVYIGDVLNIRGTVKELNETVQQAVIKIEMRNQEGTKVLRATLNVGFLE